MHSTCVSVSSLVFWRLFALVLFSFFLFEIFINVIMKENLSMLKKGAVAVAKTPALVLALLIAVCASSDVHGQSVLLVDVNQNEEETYNEYSALTAAPETLYFLGNSGTELWTSTTMPDNNDRLLLMKKFVSASNLTVVGTRLYFVADDGVSGTELWKSDGTASGTVRVKDIRPGSTGSNPDMLTNVKGTLYFSANNGITGRELWKTNGTAAGTVLVKDILPKGGNGNPKSLTDVNGTVYFAANDGVNGIELWRSNGTAEGTFMVKDIKPGARVNSSPANLVNVYGTLFFVAGEATGGRELWRSNGTADGTFRVKDIAPGINDSRINNTTAVYKTLFFSATDGMHGQELWKSDGTESGTVMVKDMTPGPAGSQGPHPGNTIANFTNISGTLFFTASLKETNYIWKSNGTAQGTIPVTRAYGAEMAAPKPMFKLMSNRVYFLNGTEWSPLMLWSMDRNGSDLQRVMEVLQYEIPPNYPELAVVGTKLYVSARPDYWFGFKLVKTDGTEEGATWLDIRTTTEDSNVGEFTHFNGKLYFTADYSSLSPGTLWVTDGTPAGTSYFSSFNFNTEVNLVELVDNNLFASSATHFALEKANLSTGELVMPEVIMWDEDTQPIRFMINVNGTLFFSNGNGQLWKTDGSNSGTQLLKDFHAITDMHPLNGKVVFRVLHEDGSEEIWGSNGTITGTVKIKTLHTGPAIRGTYEPTAIIGNTLFFVANDGVHGNELWKSDGTSTGTFMITDINTTDTGGAPEDDIGAFVPFGNTLYFSAKGSDGQWALYKKSLTNTGTVKVLNMDRVWHGMQLGDRLLLFTNESTLTNDSKTKLWVTDGTAAGTKLVLELDGLDDTFSHQIVDDAIYFSTMEGGPLWRTDGTTCGTFVIDIGSQGASRIAALGSILVFGSYDVEVGHEPRAYNTLASPENPCTDDLARLAHTLPKDQLEDPLLTGYPNPFNNEFALRVEGTVNDVVELRVFTIYGKPVEHILELEANREYHLGQSWARGIYVVHIIRKGMLARYTVIKE